ncbi:putative heavy metal-chaperone/transport protein [Planococcus antarcticus DSM 14505]|uniref:Heavy metal-binding protein n=1 Tax=Planococcus antarcticus DSM 14505 TaxID=1185653 RepID=A0A1C7DHJ7_9BACL|nr:heavy-metal-associated domain-containing protein [Planococcus antarcticus]ANU10741.1 heavy metal-binding protein [Planococcus antarcticus DSM 14505]EIM06836.1 putative heavy metal-chaperone/transport protein [Planococcus antarcticus DSM 14505]
MTLVKFQLEPLTCPSCIKKIEGKVEKMDGVEEVKVLFNSSKVKTVFDKDKVTSEELKKVIEKLGYPVVA